MAKRVAGAQLNHDNWDQEEEAEEQGRFKKVVDKYLLVFDFYLFEVPK